MAISDQADSFPLIVKDFSGGMHLEGDLSSIAQNEYALLINGRSRNNRIIPVLLPQIQSDLPFNNFQGVVGLGSVLIIIAGGHAYSRDYEASSTYFSEISGFLPMSGDIDKIYLCAVPASTVNFKRELSDPNYPTAKVNLTNGITGTPKVVVVQDGIFRPRLIFGEGASRVAKTFAEWSFNNPEYVPIGKQMMWFNNKLYIVSADGSEIFDSISGRPLDFVKAIEQDGSKLPPEFPEEASRISHKVDYNAITAIAPLNIQNDSGELAGFFVSTSSTCYMVVADMMNLIYGEPTYRNVPLFATGALNQFSFTELLGDHAFIDSTGVKLFNAISQFRNEGKQSPISISVLPLFDGIIQTFTAATMFDNYGIFAVDTIYGPGLLIYDCISQRFVALDMYPGVGYIKQFATIRVDGYWRLFFITSTGLYEAFAGACASWRFYPREWNTGNCDFEHKLNRARLVLRNVQTQGTVQVSDYADSKVGNTLTEQVDANFTPTYPKALPFGTGTADTNENLTFPFSNAQRCYNIGLEIRGDFKMELTQVQINTHIFEEEANDKTQAKAYEQ